MEEKSLGCIRKGGTRPIVEVLPETARPTKQGAIMIASMTSLISYKQIAARYPEKKTAYLRTFTFWNVIFLAALWIMASVL